MNQPEEHKPCKCNACLQQEDGSSTMNDISGRAKTAPEAIVKAFLKLSKD